MKIKRSMDIWDPERCVWHLFIDAEEDGEEKRMYLGSWNLDDPGSLVAICSRRLRRELKAKREKAEKEKAKKEKARKTKK